MNYVTLRFYLPQHCGHHFHLVTINFFTINFWFMDIYLSKQTAQVPNYEIAQVQAMTTNVYHVASKCTESKLTSKLLRQISTCTPAPHCWLFGMPPSGACRKLAVNSFGFIPSSSHSPLNNNRLTWSRKAFIRLEISDSGSRSLSWKHRGKLREFCFWLLCRIYRLRLWAKQY